MNAVVALLRRQTLLTSAAARRLPAEVAIALLVTATFSFAVRSGADDTWETFARVLSAGLLAYPLVFLASVLYIGGRIGAAQRAVATALAIAASVAWVWLRLAPERTATLASFGALVAAAFLILPIGAARGADAESRHVASWWFCVRFVERAVLLSLVLQLLYAGLSAAMAAVDQLFDLNLRGDPYLHLAGFVFFGLYPWLVAAGVEELLDAPAPDAVHGLPRAVRWFVGYVFVPLLVLYMVIVYLYHGRWLLTWEAPRNVLSPLVIGAGLLGVLATLLTDVELRRGERSPPMQVVRWFPWAFLPIVPLAAWALWMRIDAYGFTEFRYARLLGLVALLAVALDAAVRAVRRRRPPFVSSLLLLAAIALLAGLGPLSLDRVALRSQTARLVATLQDAGYWVDGAYRPPSGDVPGGGWAQPTVVRDEWAIEAGAIVNYIARHHGVVAVSDALGVEPWGDISHWEVVAHLGWSGEIPIAGAVSLVLQASEEGQPGPLPDAATLVRVRSYGYAGAEVPGGRVTVAVAQDGAALAFDHPGREGGRRTLPLLDVLAASDAFVDARLGEWRTHQSALPPLFPLAPDGFLLVEELRLQTDPEVEHITRVESVTGWLLLP